MTPNIERITKIDQALAWLKNAIKQGEHVAAGLTIDIRVGPALAYDLSDDGETMTTELCWFSDEVLALMVRSLEASRTQAIQGLRHEHTKISRFLEQEGKP